MEEYQQEQLYEQEKRPGTPVKPTRSGGLHSGRHPDENRQYEVTHLWERHHTMKRLALLGHSHKQIAEIVGCTPQTVSNILNSAIMKKELALMRSAMDSETIDVAKELQRMAPAALKILEQILEDDMAPIVLRAKVAMDNLSRNGFAPQINVRGSFDHYHFTSEEIEQIKRDALSAGMKMGCVVDAEFRHAEGMQASAHTVGVPDSNSDNGDSNGGLGDD